MLQIELLNYHITWLEMHMSSKNLRWTGFLTWQPVKMGNSDINFQSFNERYSCLQSIILFLSLYKNFRSYILPCKAILKFENSIPKF